MNDVNLFHEIDHMGDKYFALLRELKQTPARSLLWKTAAKRWRRNALVMTETVLAMARDRKGEPHDSPTS